MRMLFSTTGFIAFGHYAGIVLPVIFLWIASWADRFVPKPRVYLLTVWAMELLPSIALLTFSAQ